VNIFIPLLLILLHFIPLFEDEKNLKREAGGGENAYKK
jgi:hypothetical protein